MTGQGSITRRPNRHFLVMMGAQVLWLTLVCVLGAWWVVLVLKQSSRIAELEALVGVASQTTRDHWFRTHRMLYWESGSYFLLILSSTALLSWLYWRDILRARGIQAFFAGVTHELRTPLTSIRLQAETLAESTGADGNAKRLGERLIEDTMRLEAQVERTLELARVEGGGAIFLRSIPTKTYFSRLLKEWEAAYHGRVIFQPAFDDAVIEADATAVQVILRNLLENSFRHSRRSPVTIVVSSATLDDGKVSVLFRDDGDGFLGDPSKLGSIFHKGDESQGAGVGLYLVRILMERMGGSVRFRGEKGFEAILTFPGGSHA